jgi:O-antigen biosynthesis alpha-1,3-rhamnosyltransferase
MPRIRLAMNAVPLLLQHAGISSYIRHLGLALRDGSDVDPRFFYGLGWSREIRSAQLPGAAGLKSALLKLIPRPYWLKHFEQYRFNAGVRNHGFDIYHEPNFLPFRFNGPIVVTIHDLSPLRYPETHPADRVRNFRERLPDAIDRATRIVVDSDFVGREIVEMFGVDPARVRPIHLGVSKEYRPRSVQETAACLDKYRLERAGYVLAVGTLEPRKNLAHAIEVHATLPDAARSRAPLVVAGAKGWMTGELDRTIAAAELRGDVRWLGYVPSEDLPFLYSGARFLVYPSLYEGFGLPVLEAMASGIPVITSNQASLPEVAGDAAVMVDPRDSRALRDAMLQLMDDEGESRRRASLGLSQAARFSWRVCAQRTVEVYREAIGKVGGPL